MYYLLLWTGHESEKNFQAYLHFVTIIFHTKKKHVGRLFGTDMKFRPDNLELILSVVRMQSNGTCYTTHLSGISKNTIFRMKSCYTYLTFHYENTSMRYTAIFHGCKNDNFQMKNSNIFLIFAQNIDCGYTLELPH